jgi:hypothetical protein
MKGEFYGSECKHLLAKLVHKHLLANLVHKHLLAKLVHTHLQAKLVQAQPAELVENIC